MAYSYLPLTPAIWDDFIALFGDHGAGGCWCMYWRITRKEFSNNHSEGNKRAMLSLVNSGFIPGIISYQDKRPIGWVSVAPREDFASLERSHTLKRVDDRPVWSIVCFYAPKKERGYLLRRLITQAVDFAASHGASIIEAYPYSQARPGDGGEQYMGRVDALIEEGFKIIEQRGSKVFMRKELKSHIP